MPAPFHLAMPVDDLAAARAFYVDLLGCAEGRSAARWVDLSLFGHQLSLHLAEGAGERASNPVDGDRVPVPHFGVVLPMPDWRALAARLAAAEVDFVIPPRIRFAGEVGEQATLFLRDPAGNALEFKAFADPKRLYATDADPEGAGAGIRVGPRRIVCLTEEPTEILYALGEQDRIVGISAYTERPPAARRDKPVVSAFVNGSVDKICALEPDLVIGFSDIQADLAAKLIRRGLQVLIFNQRSLDEIFAVIETVGRLVGREPLAEALVRQYRARLDAVRSWAAARPSRPRVYFEEWDAPMISGIRWVSELITIAGGLDVFAERAREPMAKGRFVSAEEVMAAQPEVVLASWCGKPFDRRAFESRLGFDALPAVRHGRLVEVPSAIILQPGPACVTDGLDAILAALWGDDAPDAADATRRRRQPPGAGA